MLADKYLEWSPHQVTLQPNESQVIRVQRRGMATAPDGEYVSHLLIQEQPSKIDNDYETENDGSLIINLEALYEVSIPVMIVNGDIHADAKIKEAKLDKNSAAPKLSVVVEREGNRSFYGTLVVQQGKEELGRVNKFRIFTTTETRNIDVPLSEVPSGSISVVLMAGKTGKGETVATKTADKDGAFIIDGIKHGSYMIEVFNKEDELVGKSSIDITKSFHSIDETIKLKTEFMSDEQNRNVKNS